MVKLAIICLLVQEAPDSIELVRQGYLEIGKAVTIGRRFEDYQWFDEFHWTQEALAEGEARVTFNGTISDQKAIEAFESRNRYRFRFAFKAMQLAPTYRLTKEKEALSFLIRFKVAADGTFKVVSGMLGIRDKNQQTWRFEPLTDKALVYVLRGIYRNEDPYTCLVNGLPYK